MTTSDVAIPPWLGVTVVLSICAWALWKGEWAERLTGAMIPLNWGLSALLRDYSYSNPQWAGFAIDAVCLILAVAIALRSQKNWPLWAAGFRVLGVITHAARIFDPTVGAWAYITAGVIWTYALLASLAIGTWGCVQRRRLLRRLALAQEDSRI